MIVGRRAGPYLADALTSIAAVCDHLVMNDNSGAENGANEAVVRASPFAQPGRLTFVRSTFTNFSDARNVCIDATPDTLRARWALYADADEVHGDELASMAASLARMPAGVDALDGYSMNFIGSFSYWNTIHRRLRFFRLDPQRRWHGSVHEALTPLRKRVALPAIGAHYGHVCTPEMELERERLYKALGQPVTLLDKADVGVVTPALVWGEQLRDAQKFRGGHPAAARETIAHLQREWAAVFQDVERIVAGQSAIDRIRNSIRRFNYARVLAFRAAEARVRWNFKLPAHTLGVSVARPSI